MDSKFEKRADNICTPETCVSHAAVGSMAPVYQQDDVFSKGMSVGRYKLLISSTVESITFFIGDTDDYSVMVKSITSATVNTDTMGLFINLRTLYNAVNNAAASPSNGFSSIDIHESILRLKITPLERDIAFVLVPGTNDFNTRMKLMKKDFMAQLSALEAKLSKPK